MLQPGSPDDVRFAARMVVDGILPEETIRAVLAKQKELRERGKPLSVPEICLRKGWLTPSEVRWFASGDVVPADLLPGLQLGERLGIGGMSSVFRAIDTTSRAPVAVKILLPRLARDPNARKRFEMEADMLCRLRHPNLVQGFYRYSHENLHYLVMELVDGGTALDRLDKSGPFGESDALALIRQAAQALQYMHQQGLVHRDVKPGNVLLGPGGVAKLCDLGVAVAAGDVADSSTTSGTVHYLAPEQASGEATLDTRADIYALGVTLFQLTMGKLPFEGNSDEEQLSKRVFEELRAKELKGLGVSHHLHYFIKKMMAREREFRYQTPGELIADIEETIAGHDTVRGPAPSRPRITSKSGGPGPANGRPSGDRRRG